MKKNKKFEWIVGGKNVDEDPHFSFFYLSRTANDPSGVANYGEAYARYDKFNETYFVRKDKCDEISRKLLDKIKKDKKFMLQINRKIVSCCDRIKNFVYRNSDFIHNPKNYSLNQVYKIYLEHNALTEELYIYSRVPQALDRGTNHFTNYLLSYLKMRNQSKYMSFFHILTTPETPTELLKSDFDEDKIIKDIKKTNKKLKIAEIDESKWFLLIHPKIYDEIQDFLLRWGHFDYHGYGNRRLLNFQEFIIKIKENIRNSAAREDVYKTWLRNTKKMRDQKKEIIKNLLIDDDHKRLFDIYGGAGVLKIYRRSAQILNFVLLDKIIEYFSDTMNVEEYVVRFMTPPELSDFIKNKNYSLVAKAKKRFPSSIYHYKGKKLYYISDDKKIKEISKKLDIASSKGGRILKGITANLGDVRAKARVIHRPSDHFVEGEILVSESTDPDLTPIMKKSSAILTEQGGATSHACIIARELNKPCIVGIDGLLSSVRTGDLLEISGEEGTVKIVKNKKNYLIKDLPDIKEQDIKNFGGKASGLFFLYKSDFANYLPQTYCGRYNSRDFVFSKEKSEIVIKELNSIMGNFNGKVAVRSSGLGEDSKNQSWAGQYLSLLNVPPDANKVFDAIKMIYEDADRIKVDYLSKKKISRLKVGFLVQEQVDALYAGVCFTKDPITNDKNTIFIEVIKGLGEGLVSGKKKPLTCKFRKADLEVLYADKNMDSALLKVLKELAKLVFKVEKKSENFLDIEFAIDKNMNLYLLQARPITT